MSRLPCTLDIRATNRQHVRPDSIQCRCQMVLVQNISHIWIGAGAILWWWAGLSISIGPGLLSTVGKTSDGFGRSSPSGKEKRRKLEPFLDAGLGYAPHDFIPRVEACWVAQQHQRSWNGFVIRSFTTVNIVRMCKGPAKICRVVHGTYSKLETN